MDREVKINCQTYEAWSLGNDVARFVERYEKLLEKYETAKSEKFGVIQHYRSFEAFPPISEGSDLKLVREKASEIDAKNAETSKFNDEVEQNNIKVFDAIVGFLNASGFSTREYRTKTPRSSKIEYLDAIWLVGLRSHVPIKPSRRPHFESFMREVDSEENKRTRAEIENANKLRVEEEKERKLRVLGSLALKYGLDSETSSKYDILNAILKKNRYLPLIYAMQRTRGDWSNGCDDVVDAVREFVIVTDTDNEIRSELASICINFDDGRSFRDCKWNYDALLKEFVDEDLQNDFQSIYSIVVAYEYGV